MFSQRVFAQSLRAAAPRTALAPRVAIRGYAEAAAASANTRPPIALYGLDGTYASALYTAAAKTSVLDGTAKALENLSKSFKADSQLAVVLNAPALSAGDKSQVVAELLKVTSVSESSNEGKTVKNFLQTLADNNRLNILDGVCENFAQLMSAQRGEIELRITSATALDQKVLKQLETAISKSRFVGPGKKLKVVPRVSPDIKGGLVVEIGDRTIDLSVSSKLAKMNKLLQDTL